MNNGEGGMEKREHRMEHADDGAGAVQNLNAGFAAITEHWSPRVVAECNGQYLKIAKVEGEFVWHQHDNEDELFIVHKGELEIEMKDESVHLRQGDTYVVPKGVPHRPIATEECWILLFEPKVTLHTGETQTPLTKTIEEQGG